MAGGALGCLSQPMRALVPPPPGPVLRRALAGVWRGGARAAARVQSGLSRYLLLFAVQVPLVFDVLLTRASTAVAVVVAVGIATLVGGLSGPGGTVAVARAPVFRTAVAGASAMVAAVASAVSAAVPSRRAALLAAVAVAALARSTVLGAPVVGLGAAVVARRSQRSRPLLWCSATLVVDAGRSVHARRGRPALSRRCPLQRTPVPRFQRGPRSCMTFCLIAAA